MLSENDTLTSAAFVGERHNPSKKPQSLHPDKPATFARAECPSRGSGRSAPQTTGLAIAGGDIAVAAFLGEQSAEYVIHNKTQCLHPDKPAMFACGDCPRRGKGKRHADDEIIAAAAFVGECQTPQLDKPVQYACATCPNRRGGCGDSTETLAFACKNCPMQRLFSGNATAADILGI